MSDKDKVDDAAKKADSLIKILKDKNLLLIILKELRKNVIANEDMMLAAINKICLRLVINSNPTSSNVLISDATGAGKDWIIKCICDILVNKQFYHHRTYASEKLLNYWTISQKDGGTFDGHVIHFEDIDEEEMKKQAFKVRASGDNEISIVDDKKARHIRIEGKPVMIITSLKATIDIEGMRRWDSLKVDTSTRATELMKELYAKIEMGLIDNTLDSDICNAFQNGLKRVTVRIPYALDIVKLLPNSLIIRTQIQKLFDYIKASAALHQHQREKDETGAIIANMFDYDYACFCFILLGDVFGMALNKYEKEIIETLASCVNSSLTTQELANRVTLGQSSLYGDATKKGYLENMKEKGLIIQYTQYDDTIRHNVNHYSLSEDIKFSFGLKTSLVLDKESKSEFADIVAEINKIRKELLLPDIKYDKENGLEISLLDCLLKHKKRGNLDDYK